jgi:hypothetical protein
MKCIRSAAAPLLALATLLLAQRAGALSPIDLTANANLGFGQIVATPAAGSVTVSPAGGRSASGGVVLGNAFGVSAASLTAAGDANASYSLTLPTSAVLNAGADSMTADGFTSTPSGSGNLGAGGTQAIALGATLHVGAHQHPAAYSGTYIVTIAYN